MKPGDMLKDRVIAAIGDEYNVGDELGRGGMSVVYRALDLRLMRQVAIKVLPPEFAYDAGIRERFRREAQMAAQLNHPNIIPIFSVDERDGVVYFVMAVCEGESLALRLARTNKPPLDDVRRILGEVAGALAYAHGKGVVHRDIKPDNILIERESGRALVTDFGIARAAEGGSRLTVTGIAMGTPAYMSPEQAMGEHELDGRSDVYSLGALAYQMVAGITPFTASNAPSMLLKHVSEELVPLSERRRDVPTQLAATIERALQKKPDMRWQTAGEMHDALRRNEPIAATPLPKSEKASPVKRATPSTDDRTRRPEQRPRSASQRVVASPGSNRNSANDRPPENRDNRSRDDGEDWFDSWRRDQMVETNMHIGALRRALPLAGLLSLIATVLTMAVIVETPPGEEWAIVWGGSLVAAGVSLVSVRRHVRWLRDHGVRFGEALRARKVVSWSLDVRHGRGPSVVPVPLEVMDGPFGSLVRGAVRDKESVESAIAKLPAMDRKLLPEVLPTVSALAERVFALAPTLHDLDRDLQREDIARLESRITELETHDDAESSRTLQLLRRQHSTLVDLNNRREVLLTQIESAALLLQNIKLDLRKVGSAGMQASMQDVNTATQEARALSREIGHVLSAAEDMRKM